MSLLEKLTETYSREELFSISKEKLLQKISEELKEAEKAFWFLTKEYEPFEPDEEILKTRINWIDNRSNRLSSKDKTHLAGVLCYEGNEKLWITEDKDFINLEPKFLEELKKESVDIILSKKLYCKLKEREERGMYV